MDRPNLLADVRYQDAAGRLLHYEQLNSAVSEWLAPLAPQEAMRLLQDAGVPAGASYDDKKFQDDEQIVSRGFLQLADHHKYGERKVVTVPWRISGADDNSLSRTVPKMDQFRNYVLCDLLGLTEDEINDLESKGAVPGGTGRTEVNDSTQGKE
jgi:crotonobetainyl-CoA:carnitine CoA-transferase CaiB-like acyl-CoA transferase